MTASARLAELGIELPAVAKPLASYVPAVRTGNLVYTSGQLPTQAGKLARAGKVGADVTPEDGKGLARICTLNALGSDRCAGRPRLGGPGGQGGRIRCVRSRIQRSAGRRQRRLGSARRGLRRQPCPLGRRRDPSCRWTPRSRSNWWSRSGSGATPPVRVASRLRPAAPGHRHRVGAAGRQPRADDAGGHQHLGAAWSTQRRGRGGRSRSR